MQTETPPSQTRTPMRIGLLTLSELGAESLALALRSEHHLDVVLSTSVPRVFLKRLVLSKINVALIVMRPADGAANVLTHPAVRNGRVRVVVITSSDHPDQVARVRAAGALGCVPMSANLAAVAKAMRTVAAGKTAFPRGYTGDIHFPPPSEREMDLLAMLRTGAMNSEIAHALDISPRTVESHFRRMFKRYSVASRSELLMLALRHQWVGLDPSEQ
jgi:two-component system, NarL family, nitrate/nitrite response regulator NarL